jgi:hypothetical protein
MNSLHVKRRGMKRAQVMAIYLTDFTSDLQSIAGMIAVDWKT